jgi:uncharacterized membrane protein YeiH
VALTPADHGLFSLLDYAGVAVFAATGALAAARRGYSILTFCFFAAVTGVGGGTVRDLLIGAPVFWVRDPGYVAVCLAAAGAVWAFGDRRWRYPLLLWFDAIGLAAYAVLGTAKAGRYDAPPLVAIVMGVLTASVGGIIRDLLALEPSVLLKREIYITAAALGATVYVLARLLALDSALAAVFGASAAFALRSGALLYGWSLPGFGEGRGLEDTPAGAEDIHPSR